MTSIIDHPVRSPYAGVLVNIDPGSDVVSALGQANLMWGVTKTQVRAVLDGGRDPIVIPRKAAILRDNGPLEDPTPLGITGSEYVPISNLDAYSPLQPLIDLGKISPVQGGQTKDGRHTFLLCELTAGTTMLDVDPHQRFIMARTSHDGTGALRLGAWSKRLFCTNQIPSLVTGGRRGFVSIHHGHGASTKVDALSGKLEMLIGSLDQFDEEWRAMAGATISTWAEDAFIENLFPMPHGPKVTDRMRNTVTTRRTAIRTLLDSPTNDNIGGTRAALVAAATEWDQWFRGKSVERRSVRLLEGGSTQFAQRAWALAKVGI